MKYSLKRCALNMNTTLLQRMVSVFKSEILKIIREFNIIKPDCTQNCSSKISIK